VAACGCVARAQPGEVLGGRGLAGSNESAFVGEHDGLDAVAEVELGEDPVDVRRHGGLTGDEVPGDLGVGKSVSV